LKKLFCFQKETFLVKQNMHLPFYVLFWLVCWLQTTVAWTDYIGSPHYFIKLFLNCIQDEDCHFYYWHIMKTGGTTINFNMERLFPTNSKSNLPGQDRAVKKFMKNVKSYCLSKWSSYEVSGKKTAHDRGNMYEAQPALDCNGLVHIPRANLQIHILDKHAMQ